QTLSVLSGGGDQSAIRMWIVGLVVERKQMGTVTLKRRFGSDEADEHDDDESGEKRVGYGETSLSPVYCDAQGRPHSDELLRNGITSMSRTASEHEKENRNGNQQM